MHHGKDGQAFRSVPAEKAFPSPKNTCLGLPPMALTGASSPFDLFQRKLAVPQVLEQHTEPALVIEHPTEMGSM